MNNWSILGISKTKDENKIKEAYYEKLKIVHPEENPEGFKLLRKAYEEVLDEINEVDEDESCLNNIEKWIKVVEKNYEKFSLRISEESWKNVLNDNVCNSLDTKEEAKLKLLKFIMDHYYLPTTIFNLINEKFDIENSKEELYEEFPKDFIDFFIYRLHDNGIIDYDLFSIDDNKDYDKWIYQYQITRRKIYERDFDNVSNMLLDLEEIGINHPYQSTLKMRYMLVEGKIDEARKIGNDLEKIYANDYEVLLIMAEVEWESKNYKEAQKYYERILEINSNDFEAMSGIADCLFNEGELDEAKKRYVYLVNIRPNDDYIGHKIYDLNEMLIKKYLNDLEDDSDNLEIQFELAWCYYQNFKNDEALSIVEKINPTEEKLQEYYNISGRLYSLKKRYDEALKAYNNLIDIIKNSIALNGEEKELESRLTYAYFQKARQLDYLERNEEALEFYNKAIDRNGKDIYFLNCKAEFLLKIKNYDESIRVSEESLKLEEEQEIAYYNRAKALYEMRYYIDALDDCYKSIEIYPYYLEAYITILDIYDKYREFSRMKDVISRMDELNLKNKKIDLYKIKVLASTGELESAKNDALNLVKSLECSCESKELLAEVYFTLSEIYEEDENKEEALKNINKALELNSNNIEYYYFKAYIFLKLERFKEAIDIYNFIIEKEPNENAYINRAGAYRKLNNNSKAKKDCKEAIKINDKSFPAYDTLANIYHYDEHNWEKAIENYEKMLEISSGEEDMDLYSTLAFLYIKIKKYDEALKISNVGLEKYPCNKYIYFQKIKALKKLRKYEELIDTCTLVFSKNIEGFNSSDEEHCLLDLAPAYEMIDMYDKAIEVYKKIASISKYPLYSLTEIIKIYDYLGNYDKAIEYIDNNYEKAKIRDERGDLFFGYEAFFMEAGEVYMKLGSIEKANECFEIVINEEEKEYKKKDADFKICAAYRIGRCYLGMNDFKKAKVYLKEAADYPKKTLFCESDRCYESWIYLGAFYEKQKDYLKAIKMYKRAMEIKEEEDTDCVKALKRIKAILEK